MRHTPTNLAAAGPPSSAGPATAPPTTLLGALVLIAFADNFAQYPILTPLAVSLGASAVMAGWIIGAYSVANMVGNLVAGPMLDRYGAARPLAVSFGLTAVVLATYAFAAGPGSLLVVRLLHGLAAAAIVPAVFALGTLPRPTGDALARTSFLGAGIGVAAIVAPPLSGVIAARWDFATVYVLLALVFGLAALVTWRRLDSRPPAERSAARREHASAPGRSKSPPSESHLLASVLGPGLGSVVKTARAAGIHYAWVGSAAIVFGVGSLALLLPLQAATAGVAAPARTAGQLMGGFSVAAVVVMGILARAGRSGGRRNVLGVAGVGLCILGSALAGLGVAGSIPAMLAFACLVGVGFGLAFPGLGAAVAERVSAHERGRAFAIFYAFFSAGAFLGPALAGLLAHRFTGFALPYAGVAFVPLVVGVACLLRVSAERKRLVSAAMRF